MHGKVPPFCTSQSLDPTVPAVFPAALGVQDLPSHLLIPVGLNEGPRAEATIYEGRSKLLILLQLKNGRHRF